MNLYHVDVSKISKPYTIMDPQSVPTEGKSSNVEVYNKIFNNSTPSSKNSIHTPSTSKISSIENPKNSFNRLITSSSSTTHVHE